MTGINQLQAEIHLENIENMFAGDFDLALDADYQSGDAGGGVILSPSEADPDNLNFLIPPRDGNGVPTISRSAYLSTLNSIRRKEPLREACIDTNVTSLPRNATLDRLRTALADHWFPTSVTFPTPSDGGEFTAVSGSLLGHHRLPDDDDEQELVQEFGLEGLAAADEVLGYDEGEELDNDSDDEDGPLPGETHKEYQTRIRTEETIRAEQNRRAGGIKTQNAMVKAHEEFCSKALTAGQIKDKIIDEHHLLLYIRHCSERPKRTRKGVDIPGTYIGASHIKKLYFGALRIRKEQEAKNPKLRAIRPATSIHVWDALKGRMNEALQRVRNGLVPEEDAPDIVANTFLAGITEEQMSKVGKGFLMHRELRSVINGHLAWTAQNASGNRGDDFRALRLSELQPYVFLHPNQETAIPCVLGCQGEEKAGASRGMRTKVNPVYSVFIAHLDPIKCPLGAFAFYHHFIHDVIDITDALDIDWSINKSWRQVRVLHGKKSLGTPYHEQSLYNLYVKAFSSAEFISKMKAHLPRHILGYFQEKMGVDPSVTSRMGWVRGETYYDTYAPSLPKEAVLGAHGYKAHEVYDPIWRHVHVPERFLQLVCPMAEATHAEIVGRENLSGAANYWSMVITLRPYLFQCGAAIFQESPESALFRLPALSNPDVQSWMKHEYPTSHSLLKANAGSQVDLQRIQNQELRRSLEEMRSLLASQRSQLDEVIQLQKVVQRRTEVLTPAKGFRVNNYVQKFQKAQRVLHSPHPPPPSLQLKSVESMTIDVFSGTTNILNQSDTTPQVSTYTLPEIPEEVSQDDQGVYITDEYPGSLRAFANGSPKRRSEPREKTQVDLVLPPASAFSDTDKPQLLWPLVFGQESVTWNQVFLSIKHPESLWDCWRPSKTVDKYSLEDQWACWSIGEAVFDSVGIQTGVKPPLREVERHFATTKSKNVGKGMAGWRNGITAKDRKFWERFREIPEYIDSESNFRQVSPLLILQDLKELGVRNPKLKGLSALSRYLKDQREEASKPKPSELPENDRISPGENEPGPSNTGKKRKKAVDPRRALKKLKIN